MWFFPVFSCRDTNICLDFSALTSRPTSILATHYTSVLLLITPSPPIPGMPNVRHASPTWQAERIPRHAAFIVVPFFLFLLSYQCLHIVKNMSIYVYTHTTNCLETLCELPLLPNNTTVEHFYTNRERCEVLTGYLSLGCWSGGDWANTWLWTECFRVFFSNRKW